MIESGPKGHGPQDNTVVPGMASPGAGLGMRISLPARTKVHFADEQIEAQGGQMPQRWSLANHNSVMCVVSLLGPGALAP